MKMNRKKDNTTGVLLEIQIQLKIQLNQVGFKIVFPVYESLCGYGPKGLHLTSKVDQLQMSEYFTNQTLNPFYNCYEILDQLYNLLSGNAQKIISGSCLQKLNFLKQCC